jgi:ABC-type antimicrobial peptide transport system permease subunit
VVWISPKARGVAQSAFVHLLRFRARSALLSMCALLGVAVVIAATSYAQEGRMKVAAQLHALGVNLLAVSPRRTARARGVPDIATLLPQDYTQIRREIPEIVASSAELAGSFPVKAGDLTKSNCQVLGVEPAFQSIESWPLREGSFFDERAQRTAARVAVLGASVARDLFGARAAAGERVAINRVPFEVIGVLDERGQGLDAGNQDNQVYIPLTTARRRLLNVNYYSGLVLSVSRWELMDEVGEEVRASLLKRHRPIGNQPEDFWVRSQQSLLDTQAEAARRLGSYVAVVGRGGMLVFSLGMLAISWLSVAHRSVEIGTRRALGASGTDIFAQLLVEALVLNLLACTTGLGAGWLATRLLAGLLQLPRYFDTADAAALCVLALAMNLTFATVPALRAARLPPIEALRSG